MTTLPERLTASGPDSETIQSSVRYLVAEISDDEDPQEMYAVLKGAVGGAALDNAIEEASQSPEQLDDICLAVLSSAWEDSAYQARIDKILDEAKGKLPVVEVSVIAISALYGLYLLRTGGKKSSTRIVRREEDGSFIEYEHTEYAKPDSVLKSIVVLFEQRNLPPGP